MNRPQLAALLVLVLGFVASPAAAADQRTLVDLCDRTVTENTVVRVQGGALASFGTCTIVVDGARLRVVDAGLKGATLTITGVGGANLDIVGSNLRAGLLVDGTFERVLLLSSLVRGADAEIDVTAGDILIRLSTMRAGDMRVRTGDGAIRGRQTTFFRRSSFEAAFGGVDIRYSDFRNPVEATALGTGDLAFLSNKVIGSARFAGEERVAVAGNTFELRPNGTGKVDLVGEIVFANNLAEGRVSMRADQSLLVIANTFEKGRPTLAGEPVSCIIEDNVPRLPCP